jgi:hypothetical protein
MDSEPAYAAGVVLLAERGELSAGEVAEIERLGVEGRERLAAGGYLHEDALRADVELAERMWEAESRSPRFQCCPCGWPGPG